jgi:hypothetical protein
MLASELRLGSPPRKRPRSRPSPFSSPPLSTRRTPSRSHLSPPHIHTSRRTPTNSPLKSTVSSLSPRGSQRMSDKVANLSSAIGVTDCALGCGDHLECKPVTWEEFHTALEDIRIKSVMLTEYVSNVITFQWVEGQCQIDEICREGKGWENECPFCYITSMLRREAALPWVATTKYLGNTSYTNVHCVVWRVKEKMQWIGIYGRKSSVQKFQSNNSIRIAKL